MQRPPILHPRFVDTEALRIVEKLQSHQFTTYLVGGCVRDLLLGIQPKDYDIATEARPIEVKKLVRRAFIIGKRFRLVLVRRGDDQFEVATFRRSVSAEEAENSDIEGDNYFGTPEEDANRRDFTINAMFYDPRAEKILDFCNGLRDIKAGMLRMIGDPEERLVEDSIRILRALRLAHKIDFSIEPELRLAMTVKAPLLETAVLPRKREEYLKLLRLKKPSLAFIEAFDLGIIEAALPSLKVLFEDENKLTVFANYLDRCPLIFGPMPTPVELFSSLLFAFMKAHFGEDADPNTMAERCSEDLTREFALTELGMFRSEYDFILRAMHGQPSLAELERFQKRGKRRQQSFLAQETIHLSLRFAQMDYFLTADQERFWIHALK